MDEESFHAFYEQTARNLRGYLRSMLIDPTMTDDLLQESYFRLLNANLPASAEPGYRKNYLYRSLPTLSTITADPASWMNSRRIS